MGQVHGSICVLMRVVVAGAEEGHDLLVQVLGYWKIRGGAAFQLMGNNPCATNAFQTLLTGQKV